MKISFTNPLRFMLVQSVKMRNLPRGLTTLSLLIILFWGISESRSFLIPLSIAGLLAFMMAPLVSIMRRHHFPEWSAIGVSTALLVFPFLGLISVLVWQGQGFVKDFPTIMKVVNEAIRNFVTSDVGRKLHFSRDLNLTDVLQQLEGSAGQGVQVLLSGLRTLLGAGTQITLILLFAVLMLASRVHLRRSSERILKQSFPTQNPKILDEVVGLIEKFLIARLWIIIIVGAIDTLVLELFGIPYAVLLGCFLGVMTLIPAIGFIIGIIPPLAVSVAVGHSHWGSLGLFLVLLLVSFVEANILTPKMVGRQLNINALFTFIGLFGGGLLWGIWGSFLSIPILGILRIALSASPSLQPWGELLAEKGEKDSPSSKGSESDRERVA